MSQDRFVWQPNQVQSEEVGTAEDIADDDDVRIEDAFPERTSGDGYELARDFADEPPEEEDPAGPVIRAAVRAFNRLAVRIRAAIRQAAADGPPAGAMGRVRRVLDRYLPAIVRALSDAQLAAALQAMRQTGESVPAVAMPADAPEEPSFVDSLEPPPTVEGEEAPASSPVLPLIEAAAKDLRARRLLTRPEFDRLAADARQRAFTVAGVESEAVLGAVRDALAETLETGGEFKDFAGTVDAKVGEGTFLNPRHAETVWRTNAMTAASNGMDSLLENPVVAALFPYALYSPIRDDRVRPEHLALETLGIGGGPVYRLDDPVFQLFRPPWDFNCRCAWTALSVRDAADRGVKEAIEWLASGIPPRNPARVPMPPFRPPANFVRQGV